MPCHILSSLVLPVFPTIYPTLFPTYSNHKRKLSSHAYKRKTHACVNPCVSRALGVRCSWDTVGEQRGHGRGRKVVRKGKRWERGVQVLGRSPEGKNLIHSVLLKHILSESVVCVEKFCRQYVPFLLLPLPVQSFPVCGNRTLKQLLPLLVVLRPALKKIYTILTGVGSVQGKCFGVGGKK